MDDLIAGIEDSGSKPHYRQTQFDDQTRFNDEKEAVGDDPDYFDNRGDYENLDDYDSKVEEIPDFPEEHKTAHRPHGTTSERFPAANEPENDVYYEESPYEGVDDTQSVGQEVKENRNFDENIDSISKNLNNDEDYDDISDGADSQLDNDESYEDALNAPDDNSGLEKQGRQKYNFRKWQDSADTHDTNMSNDSKNFHLKQTRPEIYSEGKQQSLSGNNLVMNELEKIENELSNIETHNPLQKYTRGKTKKKGKNTGLQTNVKGKGRQREKDDINDIFHSIEELEKSKKLLAEIKDETKKKSKPKQDAAKARPSHNEVDKTDENLILRELNDIKGEISNMTRESAKNKNVNESFPSDGKIDDFGDIFAVDWVPDKRSGIPNPNVRTQPEQEIGITTNYGYSRLLNAENVTRGKDSMGKST